MELLIFTITFAVLACGFAAALASRGLLVSEDSLWISTGLFCLAGAVLVVTFMSASMLLAGRGLSALSAAGQ